MVKVGVLGNTSRQPAKQGRLKAEKQANLFACLFMFVA